MEVWQAPADDEARCRDAGTRTDALGRGANLMHGLRLKDNLGGRVEDDFCSHDLTIEIKAGGLKVSVSGHLQMFANS